MRGSECVVRMLQGLGVDVVFGLCGDTTLPLYEALYDLDHGIRHVLTRDERSASYMADAYSRLSGKVGVCEGPSGGGATYILPGVAEANGSSVPLVLPHQRYQYRRCRSGCAHRARPTGPVRAGDQVHRRSRSCE